MKLLVDEDLVSLSLLRRLQAAGHETVQCPTGTPDETVFVEAQRLGVPILTANVGRKGRHDPVGFYRLAVERVPHHGVIGVFRPGPSRWLSDQAIVEALSRLASQEQAQSGTALRTDTVTRLNDFLLF
jgi:hypothetical protein